MRKSNFSAPRHSVTRQKRVNHNYYRQKLIRKWNHTDFANCFFSHNSIQNQFYRQTSVGLLAVGRNAFKAGPEIYPSVVCNCETCFISNAVNCRVVSFCDSLQHFSALTGHIKHCLRDQLFKYTLLASSRSRQKYFCFSPEKGCCGRLVCSSVNVGLDCLKNVIIVWLFTTVNGEQSLLWSSVS